MFFAEFLILSSEVFLRRHPLTNRHCAWALAGTFRCFRTVSGTRAVGVRPAPWSAKKAAIFLTIGPTRYPKKPFCDDGCFSWMIPSLWLGNGCCTKPMCAEVDQFPSFPVGVYRPIIRIPFYAWDDYPQYKECRLLAL